MEEELINKVLNNDEQSFNELVSLYNSTLYAYVSKYKSSAIKLGLDVSDLYQEALIGLINAVKTYDKTKETKFRTYVITVVESNIKDLLKTSDRNKHKSLNNAISLDEDSELSRNLYETISTSDTLIEDKILYKENYKEILGRLTDFELKVYKLKYEGKSNKEISLILNKDIKSIENTISRIKKKVNKIEN